MADRLLLCTDLDRTLIPNGPQAESPAARVLFEALVERQEISLTYVSGRDRSLVEEAIKRYRLPAADFVIGDVGSSIYHVDNMNEWRLDRAWDAEIATDWGDYGHADVAHLLSDLAVLRLQEPARQNRHKLSYYVPVSADCSDLDRGISERLQSRGIQARLIWSIDAPANMGLLDVLPARVSKYHAIEALMRTQGFSLGNTVFCGDSGNDLEVFASAIPAVVVANADAEVRQMAIAAARKAGHAEQLYLARGHFLGMNGNYSAGMLEGIAHFQPQLLDWMSAQMAQIRQGAAEERDGR